MFHPGHPSIPPPRLALTSVLVLLAVMATGCTRVPEIEDRLTADLRAADYPDLVPLDKALLPMPSPTEQSITLEQQLDARSARLKARAEALRRARN